MNKRKKYIFTEKRNESIQKILCIKCIMNDTT